LQDNGLLHGGLPVPRLLIVHQMPSPHMQEMSEMVLAGAWTTTSTASPAEFEATFYPTEPTDQTLVEIQWPEPPSESSDSRFWVLRNC
jgi:hypothetical protein